MYSPSGTARTNDTARTSIGRVHMGSPSALEPLRAQQRDQEVNEQQHGHGRGEQDHGGSFHTFSQATTKANIRPIPATPSANSAGSQTARSVGSMAGHPTKLEDFMWI